MGKPRKVKVITAKSAPENAMHVWAWRWANIEELYYNADSIVEAGPGSECGLRLV